jgi:hypothetical protein
MCTEVIVEGKPCDTIGQLEAAIGGRVVLERPNSECFGPECCLCVVDIEASAAMHGFSLTRSDDPFIYGEMARS